VQDIGHAHGAYKPPRDSMSRTLLSLAGFQVIITGRFWVIAEVGGRRVRCASGAGAWHQREPGIWLASALPGRKTWGAQAGIPGNPSTQNGFGALTSTTSPPTGLLGVGLGGDSSPRMIAFQARLEF
ncbi:MAG: hypothetical protein WAL58_05350, partial [Terriglobales bacterium]